MKTYVIPDLHGRLDLLKKALHVIEKRPAGKVVFLGDYIDRGTKSAQILDLLIKGPPDGWEWVCLKGNHEEWFIECAEYGADGEWLACGGKQTLRSYGVKKIKEGQFESTFRMRRHLHWLKSLPLWHETPDHIFVHACVMDGFPLEEQQNILTWGVFSRGWAQGYRGKHIVHGHEGIPTGPELFKGRSNLDCRAYETGRLCVGVFEEFGGPEEIIEIMER